MKIRIKTQYYEKWRNVIRNRAESGEWETWKVVRFSLSQDSNISFRRLVHVPGNDHQYEDIQLLLCTPTKEEIKQGIGYLDIVPKCIDVKLSDDEIFAKSAVVLGRFCEVLNRYFSNLKSYQVILK